MNEPKKETVRITLPTQSPATVDPAPPPRIHLPPRPPSNALPVEELSSSIQAQPKKETARISVLPDPPPRPKTVKMTKTQPLLDLPEANAPSIPITVAPAGVAAKVDSIPRPLCWALLGVSALLFILQIWIYFS